jgi:hypothetical protein
MQPTYLQVFQPQISPADNPVSYLASFVHLILLQTRNSIGEAQQNGRLQASSISIRRLRVTDFFEDRKRRRVSGTMKITNK